MSKLLLSLSLLILLTLTACESTIAPTAHKPQGTPLGDTGIHVSGTIQSGASAGVR